MLLENSLEDMVSSLTPNFSKESIRLDSLPNKNRSSSRISGIKKGVLVDLSSPVSNRTQDSVVVSLNSSEGLKLCSRVQKSTTIVTKERAIANKRKREEESVYNTTLATVIKRFSFAKEM